MYKIPAKISYYESGTDFYHINPDKTITKFTVEKVTLKESADMFEMPKLMYKVKREDGKIFEVRTNFVTNSFRTYESAELAMKSGRDEPLYDEYKDMTEQLKKIDTRHELVENYNILDEQIDESDGWLTVYGWECKNNECYKCPIDMSLTMENGFNLYIETGFYHTKDECQRKEDNTEYIKHIKILVTFAVNDAIKRGNFSENEEINELWERSETFTDCVLKALRVLGAKQFTDAEMCAINEYVHETIVNILFQQGIPYSIE